MRFTETSSGKNHNVRLCVHEMNLTQLFIHSPVVWRKAHTDDVAVDIDHVIQRVEKLVGPPLLAEHRPTSGHLVRLDPLDTWKWRKAAA